jgi:uncharacterized membrane protein
VAKNRAVPRLASDTFRSYLSFAVMLVPITVVPFALAAQPGDITVIRLTTITYLISWAVVSVVTSGLTVLAFHRATGEQLTEWLRATNPVTGKERVVYFLNGGGAASSAISGSVVAVAAVLILAFTPQQAGDVVLTVAAVAVVVGSLVLIITAYAVRYARERVASGGLEFSETQHPVFADYLYLAVQVSTTFSSSDVSIQSTRMRNLVTAHSLISFTFNTVIVALLVSVLVTATT